MDSRMTKWYCLATVIGEWLSCGGYATTVWDYLVFSQIWPVTFCIKNAHIGLDAAEKCVFPRNPLQWTVHGLWPNSFDGNNPSFCNMSAPFDEDRIRGIRSRLEEVWPNLIRGKDEDFLWKHEWEKHGTCALDFEPLNNERKYFEKGLDLYGVYNMTYLLPSLLILPDKSKKQSPTHIFESIRNALSKAPIVECMEKRDTRSYYLSEIRLCFDKSFQLMDCVPHDAWGGRNPFINCPQDSDIVYPKNITW